MSDLRQTLERMTPEKRAVIYRIAKKRLRPWFQNPNNMKILRTLIKEDRKQP